MLCKFLVIFIVFVHLSEAQTAISLNDEAVSMLKSGDAASALLLIEAALLRTEDHDTLSVIWSNHGIINQNLGRLSSALHSFEFAISLSPDNFHAWFSLGNMYKSIGAIGSAIGAYQEALRLKVDHGGAWLNLGIALEGNGLFAHALYSYQEAYKVSDMRTAAAMHIYLVGSLLCNWDIMQLHERTFEEVIEEQLRTSLPQLGPTTVYPWDALRLNLRAEAVLKLAVNHARATVEASRRTGAVAFLYPTDNDSTSVQTAVRVGYLCGNVGDHPLVQDMLHVWLRQTRDRQKIILIAMNTYNMTEDSLGLLNVVDELYVLTGYSSAELARRIHAVQLDILIDLNGYTFNSHPEVLALQPAPRQLLFKGYVGSSGSSFISHVVSDRFTTPPSLHRGQMTERAILLSRSSFVNSHSTRYADVPLRQPTEEDRRSMGQPLHSSNRTVMCCFNNLYKVNPELFVTWMRILDKVADSEFWLLQLPADAEPYLRHYARISNIDPDRLRFLTMTPGDSHLRIRQLCDLFLDTPVYNAHGTAADALWSGVPLLTVPGVMMHQRLAASMLATLGLDELIVSSLQHYEEAAVHLLTSDRDKLLELRTSLKRRRVDRQVFDASAGAHQLDTALRLLMDSPSSHHVVLRRN